MNVKNFSALINNRLIIVITLPLILLLKSCNPVKKVPASKLDYRDELVKSWSVKSEAQFYYKYGSHVDTVDKRNVDWERELSALDLLVIDTISYQRSAATIGQEKHITHDTNGNGTAHTLEAVYDSLGVLQRIKATQNERNRLNYKSARLEIDLAVGYVLVVSEESLMDGIDSLRIEMRLAK